MDVNKISVFSLCFDAFFAKLEQATAMPKPEKDKEESAESKAVWEEVYALIRRLHELSREESQIIHTLEWSEAVLRDRGTDFVRVYNEYKVYYCDNHPSIYLKGVGASPEATSMMLQIMRSDSVKEKVKLISEGIQAAGDNASAVLAFTRLLGKYSDKETPASACTET